MAEVQGMEAGARCCCCMCVADGRWGGTHGAGLLPFWGIMLSLMLPIDLVEECFDKGVDVGGRRWCGG